MLVREFGTALAVVAVYVLVLLAPLHQAAGLQQDLAGLGYESVTTWTLCAAAAPGDTSGKSAAEIKCPAASIGKDKLATIEPGVVDLAIGRFDKLVVQLDVTLGLTSSLSPHIAEARAPPVLV